ncbi:hypothetical protein [Lysinibacillus capsici]|uniref:hypothetical protein n=1 Tax=Lysinibacillus capsici TaxID=2115968 RepID=UPI002DB9F47F|nr:hypothetical protein [Lysinibacillus capsici]MEC1305588.1 hypothetical protein [Lysinibacillus capsici]
MSDVSVRLDSISVTFSIQSTDLHEQSILSDSIHQNERCIRQIRQYIRHLAFYPPICNEQSILSDSIHQNERCIRQIRQYIRHI